MEHLRLIHEDEISLVARWLSDKENYQWLEFGSGRQRIGAPTIKAMLQRDIHYMRLFTDDTGVRPIGVIALKDINTDFHTATLWYVLGEKEIDGSAELHASRAVGQMLTRARGDLLLKSIFAWAVDADEPLIRVLEDNNFTLIGKRRQCHYLDGHPHDRLLFDLVLEEVVKAQYLEASSV